MKFLLPLSLFFLLISCKEEAEIIDQKLFVFTDSNGGRKDSANLDHYYFRHDSIYTIGFIDTVRFTEEQLSNKIIMDYKGKIRTNFVHSFACLRIVLYHDQQPIHWSGILLRDEVVDLNIWNRFKGYFVLPYRTNDRQYNKAIIYTELAEGKSEKFDIDSVEITLKSVAK